VTEREKCEQDCEAITRAVDKMRKHAGGIYMSPFVYLGAEKTAGEQVTCDEHKNDSDNNGIDENDAALSEEYPFEKANFMKARDLVKRNFDYNDKSLVQLKRQTYRIRSEDMMKRILRSSHQQRNQKDFEPQRDDDSSLAVRPDLGDCLVDALMKCVADENDGKISKDDFSNRVFGPLAREAGLIISEEDFKKIIDKLWYFCGGDSEGSYSVTWVDILGQLDLIREENDFFVTHDDYTISTLPPTKSTTNVFVEIFFLELDWDFLARACRILKLSPSQFKLNLLSIGQNEQQAITKASTRSRQSFSESTEQHAYSGLVTPRSPKLGETKSPVNAGESLRLSCMGDRQTMICKFCESIFFGNSSAPDYKRGIDFLASADAVKALFDVWYDYGAAAVLFSMEPWPVAPIKTNFDTDVNFYHAKFSMFRFCVQG
jgi:hypothetical protein